MLPGRSEELCNLDLIGLPLPAGGHIMGLLLLHHPGRDLHRAGIQGVSTLLSGKNRYFATPAGPSSHYNDH